MWGTWQRVAVNQAYSDFMGYICYAALAVSVPVVLLTLLLPDSRLGDGHNLVEKSHLADIPMSDANGVRELSGRSH